MTKTKKKIYRVINSEDKTSIGGFYNIFMLICIILSLLPLTFKEYSDELWLIDKITVGVFIIDYVLRWWTADIKFKDKSIKSYLKYPFTPMAIVDLLSILPSLTVINNGLKALRMLRLGRVLRVFKIFRFFRYSKGIKLITDVLKNSKEKLIIVTLFAIAYVFGTALLVFNIEPDTFNNFFDAVYWATVSLTAVGCGDIYLTTEIGRLIAMISAFIGIAIIALPASILTSEFMNIIQNEKLKKKKSTSRKKK